MNARESYSHALEQGSPVGCGIALGSMDIIPNTNAKEGVFILKAVAAVASSCESLCHFSATEGRDPCSNAGEYDSRTFIQPYMRFLHNDGAGYSLCCLANGGLTWLLLEPDTGLDHCTRILLSCFRARISD